MSHLRYRFDHTRFVCLLKAPQNGRYDPYYSLSCLFPFRDITSLSNYVTSSFSCHFEFICSRALSLSNLEYWHYTS